MSVEISLSYNDLDIIVTITEWEEETLFPLSGVVEMDGVGDENTLQNDFIKHNAEFIAKRHDDIFDELFNLTENIDKSYSAINDYLEESHEDEKLDRDIEEWSRNE